MKRQLFLTAACLALVAVLGGQAQAADVNEIIVADEVELAEGMVRDAEDIQTPEAPGTVGDEDSASNEPDILVNGSPLCVQDTDCIRSHTTYLSIRTLIEAIYPDALVNWTGDSLAAYADGLTLTAKPGNGYLVANGRYLYVPDGVLLENGVTLAPVRVLARALGAVVDWDASTGDISITSKSGPIESGESFYRDDAVYWLSRIINAESGNQPLAGKVAVGSVILNRVASPAYPDTIYNVIFDNRGGSYQFSPARSGSINREPNYESVLAAKLCLDGAREAGGCLYFNAAGIACWASRNRELVITIGGHSFYK